MDFIALDFETANEHRSSACEVSLVRVSQGEVKEYFTSLIKPHPTMGFHPRNVNIHGITEGDVADAREFDQVFNAMIEFKGDLPLVAHNASFDMSVLRRTSELYGLNLPDIDFFCTRVLAERSNHLSLLSYSLVNVCDALTIPFYETHRAEADALACANIALKISELEKSASLEELAASLRTKCGVVSGAEYRGISSNLASKKYPSVMGKGAAKDFLASLSDEDMSYDDDFNGKEVIFTGKLNSIERQDAQEKVIRAGGSSGNNVTKKTAIVVVGAPYDAELQPGATLSGKLKKVVDLREQGADIRLITELEFFELFEN
jgi:DNA polymerase-3 subunit epsilon